MIRVTPALLLVVASMVGAQEREVLSFDPGWKFHQGDVPMPEIKGLAPTYWYAKAGGAVGAAAMAFDDSAWRILDLPHDWAVESVFDEQKYNIAQGYRLRGYGWYRKTFALDQSDRGKHLELAFGGISTHATVWINGMLMHRNFCGYTGFTIDLTPVARYGDETNIISVRVDAVEQEGWWYEGAGIYRQTQLIKRSPVHVVTDGVYAVPVKTAAGAWAIPVEATVGNRGGSVAEAQVTSVVLDPDGREVARATGSTSVGSLGQSIARYEVAIPGEPRLWSPEHPTLYRVQTSVAVAGEVQDRVETTCGFRTIRFDANHGFFLNDQPVKIKGTCNHQDHAGVGTVIMPSLWDYRVRRLKELGSNAYRFSHNAQDPALLDACDRQGLLVMDENRNFNVGEEYLRQLEWQVRRDRNHPSIILWSVFNEEPMQATEAGYEMVRKMAATVKRLDTSRPVTAAMNGGFDAPKSVAQAVDVMGFNYAQDSYDSFHQRYPDKPLISSEDTSAFMTRGAWFSDPAANVVGSQDEARALWGNTHRDAWKQIASRPYIAGGFVWTGFDYRGESTPHAWPSASSYLGIMDTCGFPKAAYYLHQAAWIDDRPILKILPHWNWAGREGQEIPVMVACNAEEVRLYLNGKEVGVQQVNRLDANTWKVPYIPGVLEARAWKAGKEVAVDRVATTGEAVALRLVPDRKRMAGDGLDTLPITIEAIDAEGRVVPTAHPMARLNITGPAKIAGIGNGDPTCHEPEQDPVHSLFNGLAQVLVRTEAGGHGALRIEARAPGLATGSMEIAIDSATVPRSVPGMTTPHTVNSWKMSPVSATPLDPRTPVVEAETINVNTLILDGPAYGPGTTKPPAAPQDPTVWRDVAAGKAQVFERGTQALFKTMIQPNAAAAAAGSTLEFSSITGKAEVWIDGVMIVTKADAAPGPLSCPLPKGHQAHRVAVRVTVANAGDTGGLSGPVTVAPHR